MDQEVIQLCEEIDAEFDTKEVTVSMWPYTLPGRVITKLRIRKV